MKRDAKKPNVLTTTFGQRELEQIQKGMIAGYRGLRKVSAEEWMEVAEGEAARDDLDDLISDVRELFQFLGYAVPASPREKSKDEHLLKQHVETMLARNPEILHWSPEELAEFTMSLIGASQTTESRLFSAYKFLMAGRECRDAGAFQQAVNLVACGATNLVQAMASQQSEHRRLGATRKNESERAIAKSSAIRESRQLWDERERGKFPKLRTEDQFAMEVARRWPVIASISSIKKRSAEWRKEKKRTPK